jgi:hypothetical protein
MSLILLAAANNLLTNTALSEPLLILLIKVLANIAIIASVAKMAYTIVISEASNIFLIKIEIILILFTFPANKYHA